MAKWWPGGRCGRGRGHESEILKATRATIFRGDVVKNGATTSSGFSDPNFSWSAVLSVRVRHPNPPSPVLSLSSVSSPATASASSPFALHLPPRLLLASSAATPSSSASSTTTVAAQNPNPFNLNINLLPWLHELRFPRNFLCQPQPRPSPPPPSPPPPPPEAVVPRTRRLPSLRVTMEYDIEESVFANKVSCKLAGGLAKLRLFF
nr:unnamed protein product [Digitaria exilis]